MFKVGDRVQVVRFTDTTWQDEDYGLFMGKTGTIIDTIVDKRIQATPEDPLFVVEIDDDEGSPPQFWAEELELVGPDTIRVGDVVTIGKYIGDADAWIPVGDGNFIGHDEIIGQVGVVTGIENLYNIEGTDRDEPLYYVELEGIEDPPAFWREELIKGEHHA